MRIPLSTYRLQFNSNFGFRQAREIIQYLHDLGISDIYASPVFRDKKHSLHGYDIIDMNSLNPELGSGDDFNNLLDSLKRCGMGWVQDIVPNHMCITSNENAWWMDVLENGLSSTYSKFFDIDWEPVKKELKNKILLPFLGDQYGNVLESQELQLNFNEGSFFIHYFDYRFPVLPETYLYILEHRIDEIEHTLTRGNPYYVELLSIITALKHLPSYTETNHEKINERYREKEIIKRRLWTLYKESADFKMFIDENIKEFNGVKGVSASFDFLDRLLRQQVYRLSHWRVAAEEINYRRFFDINELAAIRMEDQSVFKEAHRLIFALARARKISGLRVDHPDGLYNPPEYFHRLQKNCFQNKPFYIIGEKILTKSEKMPEDWPISGTTGYSFMNSLNGIFIDTMNAKAFDNIYEKFTGTKVSFHDIVYEKKKLIMRSSMASELNTLANFLNRISEEDKHTRDFTLYSLTTAIKEVIACFPVYRTYINSYSIQDSDSKYIEHAISKAKRKNPDVSESVYDFLKNVLLLNFPEYFEEENKKEWLDFVMRFQQITGPVMAKGLEDTSFYVYNRLVSLNEVGGDPERFGISVEAFHGQNIERNKFWPHGMIATSTHDSKRSEDVRARINVLSEIPDEWKQNLMKWSRLSKKKKFIIEGQKVPDRNEEYLFYQTLIGAWPLVTTGKPEYEIFIQRMKDYMIKALREAKVNSNWINPYSKYEDYFVTFIDRILREGNDNQFLADLKSFQKKISHYGLFNSLSQSLLKITCPGVPDFYQGTDIWGFSLVDPDNRRPVDYSLRSWLFFEMKDKERKNINKLIEELLLTNEDGRIKMFLIYRALTVRQKHRELFEMGNYIPLETAGKYKYHVIAFARELNTLWAVTVTPRFLTGVVKENQFPFGREVWDDTHVILPQGAPHIWSEKITGSTLDSKQTLLIGDVIQQFPCSLLLNQ